MNKDFISFNISITVEETIELLRETQPEDEVSHYIYITDEQEKLQGVVSLKDLLLSNSQSKLREIMKNSVTMINDTENIDEAIEVCVKYDLLSLPVVDDKERLCGIVIMNDIVEEILIPTWRKRFKKVG